MADPIWYYAIDDQEHGPVTAAQLKEVARVGQLRPSDLVWKQGLDDWKPARHVAGLFPTKKKPKQAEGKSVNGNGSKKWAEEPPPADDEFDAMWQEDTSDTKAETPPSDSNPAVEEPPEREPDSPPQSPPEPVAAEAVVSPAPQPESPPSESQSQAPNEVEFQPAESEPVYEPPPPPPIGTTVEPTVAVAGEYRPQERLHRPAVKVGPVTLRVARLTVVVSLLLLVAVQGCQSLGSAYVESATARRDAAEQAFVAHWENRRASLVEKRNSLQANTNKSTGESIELGEALDDLEALDADMAADRTNLEETDWLKLEVASRGAAASHRQWKWWYALATAPLLFLLTGGSLLLAVCCAGQERWLGLALVILAAAATLIKL